MKNRQDIYRMVLTAVAAAVLCVLGPLSIPIGIVPISFTNFALFISLYALGMKNGTYGYIIYLLIGLTGVPVFSNFSGGIGKSACGRCVSVYCFLYTAAAKQRIKISLCMKIKSSIWKAKWNS
jgi:uncharacterized membrane protein